MPAAVESMFSVREVPWHGLGKILDTPPTSEEAIVAAGLDWTVEERTVFWKSKINADKLVQMPSRKVLVRSTDEMPLSLVSNDYVVLQNTKAFGFFDAVVSAGLADYETAGSLNDGKKIWILAKVRKEVTVGKNDVLRRYVLLCNGHDGNTGILIQPTHIRVVCQNTLMASLATGMVHRIYHRGDLKQQLDQAQEIIGFTEKRFVEMETTFLGYKNFQPTPEQRAEYLRILIPDVGQEASDRLKLMVAAERDQVLKLLEDGKSNDIAGFDRGTLWALYNAAVEYADWYMGKRAKDVGNFQLFGRGAAFKLRALDLATKMLKGEPMSNESPTGEAGGVMMDT